MTRASVSDLRERNRALNVAMAARLRAIANDPIMDGATCPFCDGAAKVVGYACPGFRRIELPCFWCDGGRISIAAATKTAAYLDGLTARGDAIAARVRGDLRA
jgi:hypothetical protein